MKSETVCESNVLIKNINGLELELTYSSRDQVIEEIKRLRKSKSKSHAISVQDTIDLLDRCGRLWLDRGYSKVHIERLANILNQSEELVTYELENSMRMLLRENLEIIIKEELGNIDILDNWVPTSYGAVHRQPRGVMFHNISGNAFVVVPTSIGMGLLSKNCNLVKVSADEPYFAYAFYESLVQLDPSIKDRLSVLYFSSECSDIYETVVREMDCVIHWGGEYSGRIMAELCAKYNSHLIMHGAKISFEVIDKVEDIKTIAKGIASDVICWEQKACLSPRMVFANKKIDINILAETVAESLKELTEVFPKAYLSPWSSMKSIQDRQYCLLKYSVDEEKPAKVFASCNADYTVILSNRMPEKKDIDRCFNRLIFVCPYENKDEVHDYVEENLKQFLQTMGYSGDDHEFIEKMTLLGVSIVTKPGEMPAHYPGTSHDGMHNLQEMTYVVSRQL
ncbi:acyl-CoA reductase [Clostridium cellulovorans]|uniref:Acyl-CoA reductase n=1 Tax=Clostridium cellulovorans (strain ATCC 35296 / DSM 3052 / OCM 3 / 743B) TaxID=573061 RepID=D9SMI6_CLOC7|nr:acyl-CoA reductase [Clostridium cellulovorans]ADL53842.1 acyl-CoA reductase [Clostridium cellulovorans 743B]